MTEPQLKIPEIDLTLAITHDDKGEPVLSIGTACSPTEISGKHLTRLLEWIDAHANHRDGLMYR